jgi:hypothetical protein
VSGNSSSIGGADSGGIQNYGPNPVTGTAGTLVVEDSTIAANSSSLGGGIMSWCGSGSGSANHSCNASGTMTNTTTTTTTNSTIAYKYKRRRRRKTTGGGLLAEDGTISVENSIVAENTVESGETATNCGTIDPGSTITSLRYNLESGSDCVFRAAGDQRTPTRS